MKKLLALLLLSPLASSETWEEYIEEYNLQLTHIVCEHSGEQVKTMVTAEVKENLSHTDYFYFNNDYLFASLERDNYETLAFMVEGVLYQPVTGKTKVTVNDEVVSFSFETNGEGLERISTDDEKYTDFDNSWTINRLNGTIKSTASFSFYSPSLDANGYSKSSTSGTCSLVTDKN